MELSDRTSIGVDLFDRTAFRVGLIRNARRQMFCMQEKVLKRMCENY